MLSADTAMYVVIDVDVSGKLLRPAGEWQFRHLNGSSTAAAEVAGRHDGWSPVSS